MRKVRRPSLRRHPLRQLDRNRHPWSPTRSLCLLPWPRPMSTRQRSLVRESPQPYSGCSSSALPAWYPPLGRYQGSHSVSNGWAGSPPRSAQWPWSVPYWRGALSSAVTCKRSHLDAARDVAVASVAQMAPGDLTPTGRCRGLSLLSSDYIDRDLHHRNRSSVLKPV